MSNPNRSVSGRFTACAALLWAVTASVPVHAQTVADEKPLTGAALAAAKRDMTAMYKEGAKIRAAKGQHAAFDAMTTPDFTFTFAPGTKTETIPRDRFLKLIGNSKKGGGHLTSMGDDDKPDKDDPRSRPNRYVTLDGGKEIVRYEYPMNSKTENASTPSATTTVTKFTIKEAFARTPQGLRMKGLGLVGMAITMNGQAIPPSMLDSLTFDQFAASMTGDASSDKGGAKPTPPPVVPPAVPAPEVPAATP